MKPRLEQTVYCIYEGYDLAIFADKVYAIGKDSFIVEGFGKDTYEDSWEWWFKDYNKTWFTNLDKAKKAIRKQAREEYEYKRPVLVEKFSTDYYGQPTNLEWHVHDKE